MRNENTSEATDASGSLTTVSDSFATSLTDAKSFTVTAIVDNGTLEYKEMAGGFQIAPDGGSAENDAGNP